MKIRRTQAEGMNSLLLRYIVATGHGKSHNKYRIDLAWAEASGASEYTTRTFFRDGTLYVTLNSSVARSMLLMQSETMRLKINSILSSDELFLKEGSDKEFIKHLVLK